jgi:probable rRNA maturation factor
MVCQVYINIDKKPPFSLNFLSKNLNQASKILKMNQAEISIILVGDRKIRTLNKKFRQIDKVTDVLSFSQQEGAGLILPKGEKAYLGDVFICWPQVKRQAKLYGLTSKQELFKLATHGLLHLLGYDHVKLADYQKMSKLETKIWSQIYD